MASVARAAGSPGETPSPEARPRLPRSGRACLAPLAALLLAVASDPAAAQSPLAPGAGGIHVGGRPATGPLRDGTGSFPDALPHYHIGDQVICSDCHIVHASQSHLYDPAGPAPGEEVPYAGGANPHLLKAPDPLDLCLTCHDGQSFAPDVLGADANGLVQRSAGHFGTPDQLNPLGHDLGRGLPPAATSGLCLRCHFGSPGDEKVTCIDCHNPHGSYVARNLQWASDPYSTPDLGLFVDPAATGMDRYEEANVSFGTLDSPQLREVTNMCIDCHHTFSGSYYVDPDGNGIHSRHPAYDSERGSPNTIDQGAGDGGSDPAHWEAGTGSGFHNTPRVRFVVRQATDYPSGTVVDASANGVFCLSCHRAHGSDQPFGLVWALSGGYSAPGCDQCHRIADVASP